MFRSFSGAILALILLLAVACGAPSGRAPTTKVVERAFYAKEKRKPSIAAEQPRRGRLRRIGCRPVGLLPGVGRAFLCQVDYQNASTTTCAAFDRDLLVRCRGAPSCTKLHRPSRGLADTVRFTHPFGWRLEYAASLYFFSCRHRLGKLNYFETVISNFDTRAGRLLNAGREAFPAGGVALRISTLVGGPRPIDATDTRFPLEPGKFTPEPPFASADTILSHSFAIDNHRFNVQVYFDARAPLWEQAMIEQVVRSIRRGSA